MASIPLLMYLVVGATGLVGLGGEICRRLRAAGKPTRALVRPTANADRVAHLRSGLVYTVLQPTFYMEVWLAPIGGFDFANARASIYGRGSNQISWVSMEDVARFAAMCVDTPAARNATFELGGPQALTPLEAVRIFEDIGGRRFEVEFVSEEQLEEQQDRAANSLEESLAGLRRCYAAGDVIEMSATLATFPMTLTSVRDYARRVLFPSQMTAPNPSDARARP